MSDKFQSRKPRPQVQAARAAAASDPFKYRVYALMFNEVVSAVEQFEASVRRGTPDAALKKQLDDLEEAVNNNPKYRKLRGDFQPMLADLTTQESAQLRADHSSLSPADIQRLCRPFPLLTPAQMERQDTLRASVKNPQGELVAPFESTQMFRVYALMFKDAADLIVAMNEAGPDKAAEVAAAFERLRALDKEISANPEWRASRRRFEPLAHLSQRTAWRQSYNEVFGEEFRHYLPDELRQDDMEQRDQLRNTLPRGLKDKAKALQESTRAIRRRPIEFRPIEEPVEAPVEAPVEIPSVPAWGPTRLEVKYVDEAQERAERFLRAKLAFAEPAQDVERQSKKRVRSAEWDDGSDDDWTDDEAHASDDDVDYQSEPEEAVMEDGDVAEMKQTMAELEQEAEQKAEPEVIDDEIENELRQRAQQASAFGASDEPTVVPEDDGPDDSSDDENTKKSETAVADDVLSYSRAESVERGVPVITNLDRATIDAVVEEQKSLTALIREFRQLYSAYQRDVEQPVVNRFYVAMRDAGLIPVMLRRVYNRNMPILPNSSLHSLLLLGSLELILVNQYLREFSELHVIRELRDSLHIGSSVDRAWRDLRNSTIERLAKGEFPTVDADATFLMNHLHSAAADELTQRLAQIMRSIDAILNSNQFSPQLNLESFARTLPSMLRRMLIQRQDQWPTELNVMKKATFFAGLDVQTYLFMKRYMLASAEEVGASQISEFHKVWLDLNVASMWANRVQEIGVQQLPAEVGAWFTQDRSGIDSVIATTYQVLDARYARELRAGPLLFRRLTRDECADYLVKVPPNEATHFPQSETAIRLAAFEALRARFGAGAQVSIPEYLALMDTIVFTEPPPDPIPRSKQTKEEIEEKIKAEKARKKKEFANEVPRLLAAHPTADGFVLRQALVDMRKERRRLLTQLTAESRKTKKSFDAYVTNFNKRATRSNEEKRARPDYHATEALDKDVLRQQLADLRAKKDRSAQQTIKAYQIAKQLCLIELREERRRILETHDGTKSRQQQLTERDAALTKLVPRIVEQYATLVAGFEKNKEVVPSIPTKQELAQLFTRESPLPRAITPLPNRRPCFVLSNELARLATLFQLKIAGRLEHPSEAFMNDMVHKNMVLNSEGAAFVEPSGKEYPIQWRVDQFGVEIKPTSKLREEFQRVIQYERVFKTAPKLFVKAVGDAAKINRMTTDPFSYPEASILFDKTRMEKRVREFVRAEKLLLDDAVAGDDDFHQRDLNLLARKTSNAVLFQQGWRRPSTLLLSQLPADASTPFVHDGVTYTFGYRREPIEDEWRERRAGDARFQVLFQDGERVFGFEGDETQNWFVEPVEEVASSQVYRDVQTALSCRDDLAERLDMFTGALDASMFSGSYARNEKHECARCHKQREGFRTTKFHGQTAERTWVCDRCVNEYRPA